MVLLYKHYCESMLEEYFKKYKRIYNGDAGKRFKCFEIMRDILNQLYAKEAPEQSKEICKLLDIKWNDLVNLIRKPVVHAGPSTYSEDQIKASAELLKSIEAEIKKRAGGIVAQKRKD